MIKFISKFLVFFVSLYLLQWYVSASDNHTKINSIKYTWYLWDNTLITIDWENFNNCSKIAIDNNAIVTQSISENKITYLFWDNIDYKWVITLNCDWLYASENFEFPYIENAFLNNNLWNWEIRVMWKNFLSGSKALFELWWTLSINSMSTNSIVWKFPSTLKTTNLYIERLGLKSNLFKLDIDIPKITHITSDNWFYRWNKIIVHWENLNNYNNSVLYFWEHLISNQKYNEEDKTFSFLLPYLSWLNPISVISNWISSNIERVDVLWDNPYITSVHGFWERVEVNWTMVYKDKIIIKWDNFPMNDYNFKLYWNNRLIYSWLPYGTTKQIGYNYNDFEEIVLYWIKLKNGNNFFHIEYNWTQSNIYNLNNNFSEPYISYVHYWKLFDTKRIFDVGLGNFDLELDQLYYNNSIIQVKSCLDMRCRIEFDNNILYWSFYIKSGDFYKSIPYNFDFRQEKIHIIDEVTFDSDPKVWTKFIIKWENFYDTTSSFSNLAVKDSFWRYEIEETSNELSWKIGSWFDPNSSSTINLRKFLSTISLKFIWKDVINKRIYWNGFISELISEDDKYLIKPWDKIKVIWKWFHINDKVKIWSKEIKFWYIDKHNWYFTIPNDTIAWKYSIELKNINWWFSNKIDILINELNFNSELILKSDLLDFKKLYLETNYTDEPIYWFNINNKINDLIISDLDFKITSSDSIEDLWLFTLILNWENIGNSMTDKDWNLKFEDIIITEQLNDHKFQILKNSSFLNSWTYNIALDNIYIVYRWTSEKFNNVDYKWLDPRKFTVFNKKLITCLDTLVDNSNCLWDTNSTTTEDSNSVETPKNTEELTESIEDKYKKVYDRIDNITTDLFEKNSKLSLFKELNTYKNLRFLINNVLIKYKNSKNKIFIQYFYEKIDKKYKTVFKEYILSKK